MRPGGPLWKHFSAFLTLISGGKLRAPADQPEPRDRAEAALLEDYNAVMSAIMDPWVVDFMLSHLHLSERERSSLPFPQAVAYAFAVHHERFGLIDVPASIGDFIGIDFPLGLIEARSMFRRHDARRPMLFSSGSVFYADRPDSFYSCEDETSCRRHTASSGATFSAMYQSRDVTGPEASEMHHRLGQAVLSHERSLRPEREQDVYTLLSGAHFPLSPQEWTALSGGQFVSVPKDHRLTIELSVRHSGDAGQPAVSFHRALLARDPADGREIRLPMVELPQLRPGESFDLSLSQSAEVALSQLEFSFAAHNPGPTPAAVDVQRLDLVIDKAPPAAPFEVHRFVTRLDCGPIGVERLRVAVGCDDSDWFTMPRDCTPDGHCNYAFPILPDTELREGEQVEIKKVRFRTLGCYPLTGAIESEADDLPSIVLELLQSRSSERQGRVIDKDSNASMEKKKQEGYF